MVTWSERSRSSSDHSDINTPSSLSSARREGYWKIATQLEAGQAHLHVPPQLSIGKILWPKVHDHWKRFAHALYSTSHSPTIPSGQMADIVELRSSQDPQLATTLDLHLKQCREQQRTMGLMVIKEVSEVRASQGTPSIGLPAWQQAIVEAIERSHRRSSLTRFSFAMREKSRSLSTTWIAIPSPSILRDVLNDISQIPDLKAPMIDKPRLGLIGGVACVSSPTKKFQLEQLTQAAWRCLEAAHTKAPAPLNRLKCFRISLYVFKKMRSDSMGPGLTRLTFTCDESIVTTPESPPAMRVDPMGLRNHSTITIQDLHATWMMAGSEASGHQSLRHR